MSRNCPTRKPACKNSAIVNSVKNLINQLESDNITNFIPITKKEIKQTKRALDTYIKECSYCTSHADNDYHCMNAAAQNLQRRIPLFSKNIYPWKNYDWDYNNHISNNYSVERTKAKVGSTLSALRNNVNSLVKVINGITDDPIPNKYSRAGVKSIHSDYPKFEDCDAKCQATQRVKNALSNQLYNPPTKDKFLKKKLHGKYSSSYFMKIGSCPRSDITDITACEKRGYTWTPNILDKVMNKLSGKGRLVNNESGSCSQPRYMFVDNSAKPFLNGSNMMGVIPSIANDIISLSPDKILNAAMGKSTSGEIQIQQCKSNDIEGYRNYNESHISKVTIFLILLLIAAYLFFKAR